MASQSRLIADVGARRIARVYAEALLNAAERQGQQQALLDEFKSLIDEAFAASPQLETVLSGAAVGRTAREHIIQRLFEPNSSPLLYNFLRVLNDHERLDLLRSIYHSLRELNDERARRVRVGVATAVPLIDEQRARLRKEIQDTLHLEPVFDEHVDPELLGGMRVRVGDWQFDATVATELENLRKEIMARGAHEIQTGRDRFSAAS